MFDRILIVALALVVMFSLVQANVAKAQYVTDGLVSYWTFDAADVDGNILKDVAGTNDGTINGSPQPVPGKLNEAFAFTGDEDYIDCGSDASLSVTSGLTVEGWVYWEGGCSPIAGIERSYRIWIYLDDQMYVNLATADVAWAGLPSAIPPTLNQWIHVAMVYDGSNVTVYVDGVKSLDVAVTGDVAAAIHPFFIGVYLPPRPDCNFSGMIDELRVYDRGLSENEILQNMVVEGGSAVGPIDKLAHTWGEIKDSK